MDHIQALVIQKIEHREAATNFQEQRFQFEESSLVVFSPKGLVNYNEFSTQKKSFYIGCGVFFFLFQCIDKAWKIRPFSKLL